jgi:hypothetical protein
MFCFRRDQQSDICVAIFRYFPESICFHCEQLSSAADDMDLGSEDTIMREKMIMRSKSRRLIE